MIARQHARRRPVRRPLIAAPAAALLAVVPVAAADPAPAGLSVNIPPLISLSIPAQSGPLEPGLRLLIPEIIDLAIPIDFGGPGLPLGGLRLSLPNIDLPPNLGIFAGKLIGISGLGEGLAALAPSLALAPDAAVAVGTASGDVTCPLAATIKLPTEKAAVTGTVRLGSKMSTSTPCTSKSGVPFKGGSGELTGSGAAASTPAGVEGSQSGTLTIIWDNGETSTITEDAMIQGGGKAAAEGEAPVVARVTGGSLQGDTVGIQEESADFTEVSGSTVLEFVGTAEFKR